MGFGVACTWALLRRILTLHGLRWRRVFCGRTVAGPFLQLPGARRFLWPCYLRRALRVEAAFLAAACACGIAFSELRLPSFLRSLRMGLMFPPASSCGTH